MDFKNGAELLALCEEHQCPVSEIMKIRECDCGETTLPVITDRMNKAWEIMKESASSPVADPPQIHRRTDRRRGETAL